MNNLRVTVRNGRIVLDEPTDLPEGTVLDLVADDGGDDLDEDERAMLKSVISKAWQSAQECRVRPASEVIEVIRSAWGH